MSLPRGIWFDERRARYRVRLYRRWRVIHLSYHVTLKEAVVALAEARTEQRFLKAEEGKERRSVADRMTAVTRKILR